jgi:hypothetical protein
VDLNHCHLKWEEDILSAPLASQNMWWCITSICGKQILWKVHSLSCVSVTLSDKLFILLSCYSYPLWIFHINWYPLSLLFLVTLEEASSVSSCFSDRSCTQTLFPCNTVHEEYNFCRTFLRASISLNTNK